MTGSVARGAIGRRLAAPLLAALLGWAAPGGAGAADEPGEFDYFVMALSWNASWCEAEGDSRGAEQCDPRFDHGFTLHGLWPQHERGFPEYCRSARRDPTRAETGAMADIMGSGGLAWHQWKKHGRCTGLSGRDYLRLSREAWSRVERPELLRRLDEAVTLPAGVIEDAFLEVNPDLPRDGVTVVCRGGRIAEVRICLTRALEPRDCGADVRRDCSGTARLPPMR